MARYLEGRLKVIRRLGTPLPGLTSKTPRSETPAPRVGRGAPRRKLSDYGRQLMEKQKVRYHYGVSESQLRRYFAAAARARGVTGETLLSLLERRLDNVVFRLGFAPTIPAARQLVTHGHVLVNGGRVNVPAYSLRTGETVAIRPEARQMPLVQESVAHRNPRAIASYLELADGDPFSARVTGEPRREDVPIDVDEAAVVAFYARR